MRHAPFKVLFFALIVTLMMFTPACSRGEAEHPPETVRIVIHAFDNERCTLKINGKTVYDKIPPDRDFSSDVNETFNYEIKRTGFMNLSVGDVYYRNKFKLGEGIKIILVSGATGTLEYYKDNSLMLD